MVLSLPVFVLGLTAALVIENLHTSLQRSRQKRTMAAMSDAWRDGPLGNCASCHPHQIATR